MEIQKETGKNVFCIFQLRFHPAILALKERIKQGPAGKKYTVGLNYITPRGKWYRYSWKGDVERSGGVATNIGLHFFDLLLWLFGDVQMVNADKPSATRSTGTLLLENAEVQWLLSIDANDLPENITKSGKTVFRSLNIDGELIDFSRGMEDLHTIAYSEILKGNHIGLSEARKGIQLVHNIRTYAT
jgi:UDP-N-acetyl-2-amino-2-deoxyglucuronate dehydrogenase